MVQRINSQNAKMTLGYWGIRGLGQPIRFLLACAEVPFSEIRVGVLQDGTLLDENKEGDDWTQIKAELEMPFPNLPFLIDEGQQPVIRISQSNAILRYLARKFDLYGDSDLERMEIDVLQDEAYDFRNSIIDTAYTLGEGYAKVFEEFKANALPRHLDRFEQYLKNRTRQTYFVGSRLSLIDCLLYELVWQMTLMVPGSVSQNSRPTLNAFLEAFEEIPQIKKYMQSDHYIKRPINSPWASFA